MMSQVGPFLEFEPDYILDEDEKTCDYYEKTGQELRPWSFGTFFSRNCDEIRSADQMTQGKSINL